VYVPLSGTSSMPSRILKAIESMSPYMPVDPGKCTCDLLSAIPWVSSFLFSWHGSYQPLRSVTYLLFPCKGSICFVFGLYQSMPHILKSISLVLDDCFCVGFTIKFSTRWY
jgi:hypothetical protein